MGTDLRINKSSEIIAINTYSAQSALRRNT